LTSTFYYYHHLSPDHGIYRSTNGGATWTKVAEGPFTSRWNYMLKTTPGYANDLWLAEGKQATAVGGIWHSTDGGETWTPAPGIQQVFSFGFGKAKVAGGYPAIYAAGIVNSQHGIYRSTDAGNTWEQIGDYPLGIYDYVDDIDGDKDVFGKVYLCFSGAGFAYGEETTGSSIVRNRVEEINISHDRNFLNVTGISRQTQINIYTLTGLPLYRAIYNTDFSVNLNERIRTGVYIVSLFDGEEQITQKIIL
jgi:photosystem II stability/assembly factor-like uncharacterized protein